jgi:hypothetical protein
MNHEIEKKCLVCCILCLVFPVTGYELQAAGCLTM